MTKVALSHVRDCVLLAASFAMILFVVLMPGTGSGTMSQVATRALDGSAGAAGASLAGRPRDGRLAGLSAEGAERDAAGLAAEADADR